MKSGGPATRPHPSDEDFDDQIKQAAWLLCAPKEEIAAAIEHDRTAQICEAS